MANRESIYSRTGGKCFYCGTDLDLTSFHIDHFVPKIKGGRGGDNLVPACADCNLFKADKTIDEFRTEIIKCLDKNIQGRMMRKYLGANEIPIVFWYEENKCLKSNG